MEIKIKNLSKNFYLKEKKVEACRSVNLTIPSGEIFTILGPSGCGKTTLLRCIAGLEVPDSGEIWIGNEVVFSRDKEIFTPPDKRRIGMVFQTYAIWPHMTVFDNVAYPLQVKRIGKEEIKSRVKKILEYVKLEGLEDRPAVKLSGGQQQRVALARALVFEPEVLLLDEPLSNLDAKLREEMRKELRSFLSELKITTLYVTHDQLEALTLSDTIAIMNEGAIIDVGAPKEIYLKPRNRFIADFIGKANIIEGKIVGLSNGQITVDSPIGFITCAKALDMPKGSNVKVSIRPESFEILEGEDAEVNTFRGRIESLVFTGESYEAFLRIGNARIMMKLNPMTNLKEGNEIKLYVNPISCIILAE
jgi:iron(III) transport system ATP-binding protein